MKIGYLIVGVSGSGKSTVTRELCKVHKNAAVFSLDNCRMDFKHSMNPGQWWSDNDTYVDLYAMAFENANVNPEKFNSFVNNAWEKTLQNDIVIVDNTNLTRKSRARWCNELHSKGFNVVGVCVNAPLQVVLDRQSSREDKSVPSSVVRDMYMRQQELLVGSEVDEILQVDGTQSPVIFRNGNFAK